MRFLRNLHRLLMFVALAAAAASPAFPESLDIKAELGQAVLYADEPGHVYLRISIRGRGQESQEQHVPLNIALVLDRSGSMSGARLAAAKDAATMALSRLAPGDTIALVVYNHNVDILEPAAPLGASFDRYRAKIEGLRASGTTALYAGVAAGGHEVRRFLSPHKVNRVILLSDGLANVGPSTPAEAANLGRELAGDGISVTTIGLGLDYNEDLMTRLAAASDGNHAFVESPDDLAEIFNREFGDAQAVMAQDAEIEIDCGEAFEPLRFLGRTGEISGRRARVKLAHIIAKNERYVLLELSPKLRGEHRNVPVAEIRARYLDLASKNRREETLKVEAAFSPSREEAEASLNKGVMAEVAAQTATEESEKAIELRDKGDAAGAKRLLEQSAARLRAQKEVLGSGPGAAPPPAVNALSAIENKNAEAARNLDSNAWNRTRKDLRSGQHKSKVQQSY